MDLFAVHDIACETILGDMGCAYDSHHCDEFVGFFDVDLEKKIPF